MDWKVASSIKMFNLQDNLYMCDTLIDQSFWNNSKTESTEFCAGNLETSTWVHLIK